jgi:hypothetical protein
MSTFSIVPWAEDRVRFEQGFKPGMVKLLKQTMPEFRLMKADFKAEELPMGTRAVSIRLVIADSTLGLELEPKV